MCARHRTDNYAGQKGERHRSDAGTYKLASLIAVFAVPAGNQMRIQAETLDADGAQRVVRRRKLVSRIDAVPARTLSNVNRRRNAGGILRHLALASDAAGVGATGARRRSARGRGRARHVVGGLIDLMSERRRTEGAERAVRGSVRATSSQSFNNLQKLEEE